MGSPHVTSLCWCMGLRTGAKCVGFLHLAVATALVCACAALSAHAHARVTEAGAGAGAEAEEARVYAAWRRLAAAAACASLLHVALALLLLYSVHKRRAGGVRAWVCVMSALFACAAVYVAVVSVVYGLSSTGSDIFLAFLQGLLFFGVLAYCIIGVHSYYLFLRNAEMDGPKVTI